LFVEEIFRKCVTKVSRCTADVQARIIHRWILRKYDRSECCAAVGIVLGVVILLLSSFIPRGSWCATAVRIALSIFALWWAAGAFFYPLKVVLVDLPTGGELKSPTRSIILLFFNYIGITIHFASVYLLSLSISYSVCQNPITCPLEALYFSIVTITTLGYGDIHPISCIGRTLVSVEVLVGIALIVTALARFLSESVRNKRGDNELRQNEEGKK